MSVSDDHTREAAQAPARGPLNGEALANGRTKAGSLAGSPEKGEAGADGPGSASGSDKKPSASSPEPAEAVFLKARDFSDWKAFEEKHGALIERHFGVAAPVVLVMTDRGEMYIELPRPGDDATREIERLLARCEYLHIEAHQFLRGQHRKRCMRSIASIARQLFGYLDPHGPGLAKSDIQAIDHQIGETRRMFRRAALWHAQMQYFQGMAWMTTLLALLLGAAMTGIYVPTAEPLESDPRNVGLLLVTMFGVVLFGSILVLALQAKFTEWESDEAVSVNVPGFMDDLARLYRGARKLLGLIVIIGLLAAVSETIAYHADGTTSRPLLVCLLAGLIGATVSVMWRMSSGSLMVDYEVPSMMLRFLGAFRPILGSVFGMILYILLTIGLINLPGTSGADGTTMKLNLYFAVAFLAGFSERLAPDMLDKAARRFGRDEHAEPPKRPGSDASAHT